jgi:hypothetical protein
MGRWCAQFVPLARTKGFEPEYSCRVSNEHGPEPHSLKIAPRLNWLRAGVLGANDGIVSIAALVVGVAAATQETLPVLIAGTAGIVAGSLSKRLSSLGSERSCGTTRKRNSKSSRGCMRPKGSARLPPHRSPKNSPRRMPCPPTWRRSSGLMSAH